MGATTDIFTISSQYFHKLYKAEKKVKKVPKEDVLTYKEYRKMEELMSEFIIHRIVEEQKVFTIPETLGVLMFRCSRQGNVVFGKYDRDMDTDHVKGARRRFLNASTFGRYFVPYWWKDGRYVRNKTIYEFRLQHSVIKRFTALIREADKNPNLSIINK